MDIPFLRLLLPALWVLQVGALGQDAKPGRVPWTTSRITGTPEPPPPYRAEVAFPKLVFDRPLLLEAVPGTDRLIVGEVDGSLLTFLNRPDTSVKDVAIELASNGRPCVALYGLAFHPRFEENRQVFLFYVMQNDIEDGTRISRFTMPRTDPPTIDSASEEILLTFRSGGHNGGYLAFGNDGYLYISTGDAEVPSPPDPRDTGQDVGDLLSSILRIDVDRRDPGLNYRIPPDNPFRKTSGARPEVWAYGFRNPWRMSFDRKTGDLWVGDVGWELWELVHRVERGGNYGWSIVEGRQSIRPEGKRGPTPIQPPIVDHSHSEAASITGGYVYHGARLPGLADLYLYGDYQSGLVWGLRYENRKVTWRGLLADTGLRIVSFGQDHAGELYLVEYERTNQIYRLAQNAPQAQITAFPKLLSETGLFASTPLMTPASGVVPYDINAEGWADGMHARRWLAIPGTAQIRVAADAQSAWKVPDGSVLAKTVLTPPDGSDPPRQRRIETQILHRERESWRAYTYSWNDVQTDAALVEAAGKTIRIEIPQPDGGVVHRNYRVAARSECIQCHNPWVEAKNVVYGKQSASPLALSAEQLNRAPRDGGDNQLAWLSKNHFFAAGETPDASRPALTDPYEEDAPLDQRARAYLHVNCAHCHQFNAGGAATIGLAAGLPLAETKTVEVRPIQGTFGIDDARIIKPGAPERSVLFYRIAKTGAGHMPRAGATQIDPRGVRLIGDFIEWLDPARGFHDLERQKLALELNTGAGDEQALETLVAGRLSNTSDAIVLMRALDDRSIPRSLASRCARLAMKHGRPEARDLFERFLPDSERTERLGDAIDVDALIALEGNAERGRRWYQSPAAQNCRTCHSLAGEGGAVGPPLDAIGQKHDRRALLEQIVRPSQMMEDKFQSVAVATRGGAVHVGVVIGRDPKVLSLRDAQNQRIDIRVAEIEEEQRQGVSIMPEGLLRDLTAQEAADLIAFLSTLRAPSK